jgi:hypothetical protein
MRKETYEFSSKEQRLLVKVIVPHVGYNLSEGDLLLLGPITNNFHHPKNAYGYDSATGRWRGRYSINWFEIVKEFDSNSDVRQYLQLEGSTSDIELQTKGDKLARVEQLSLFS